MSAIDEVRRAQRETFTGAEAGEPALVEPEICPGFLPCPFGSGVCRWCQEPKEAHITAEVPAPREVLEAIEVDKPAFERLLSQKLGDAVEQEQAVRRLTEATADLTKAFEELRIARTRDRHRRLFGHPLARVFVLGDRIVVVHPAGGAA